MNLNDAHENAENKLKEFLQQQYLQEIQQLMQQMNSQEISQLQNYQLYCQMQLEIHQKQQILQMQYEQKLQELLKQQQLQQNQEQQIIFENQNRVQQQQFVDQQMIFENQNQKQYGQQQEDPFFNSMFVLKSRFDVPKKYQLLKPQGCGGFGTVVKALNIQNNQIYAIKKILRPFVNKQETKRMIREIQILKYLKHDNIISIKEILNPLPKKFLNEIYLVMEFMESDLDQIIKSDQQLSEAHIQFFMYQLFCGLKYLHSAKVFHRDLKPGNLLVNQDCEIKICDFGLARAMNSNQENLQRMTEYVATRWYRCPELLVTWKEYSSAVDMWSAGCIFAELLLRKPLLPGENYMDQLLLTINLVGTPSQSDIKQIISQHAQKFINSLPYKPRQDFNQYFVNQNPLAIDLISKLLVFNPNNRLTAAQALEHEYFASIREPQFEISANHTFNLDFDDQDYTSEQLQDIIYQEIMHYNPNLKHDNPNSFQIPCIPDKNLLTLDSDGSLIYIDYSKTDALR